MHHRHYHLWQDKANALTQEESVAKGTNNALKEERTKLSTFITETIEPLKQQYTAAVAAASKAAAEFERIKAIKPAAEVEVAAAATALEIAEKTARETAARLKARQDEAAASEATNTAKVANAETAYEAGVAATHEVKGHFNVAKAKSDNQRSEFQRADAEATRETHTLEDERTQAQTAEGKAQAAQV